MSQENVELARSAADAYNQGDLDALLALCDPDLEFHSRLVAVEGGGPYRGYDGIRAWWKNLHAAWRDLSLEIDEVRERGEVTVSYMRLRGHGMDSDAPWEQAQWHVVEWRNGKAISWRTFLSEVEALEAAGLSE
jgi:ketosteroid isomerase-like protein